jgi:hypothetical protein
MQPFFLMKNLFSQNPKYNEQIISFKGLHLLIKFDTDKALSIEGVGELT